MSTMRPAIKKLMEIMDNAAKHGGNKTPKPERVSAEAEREKLLGRLKQKET